MRWRGDGRGGESEGVRLVLFTAVSWRVGCDG